MDYRQEVRTAKEYGVSPVVLIEQIFPVASGLRHVSEADAAEFYNPYLDPESRRSLHLYVEKHGLDVAVIPDIQNAYPADQVYFFRQDDKDRVLSSLEDIRRKRGDKRFRYESMEASGTLLGYPTCCIDAFIDDNSRYGILHEFIRLEEQLGKYFYSVGSSLNVQRAILPAFYTLSFFPCRPDCEHAIGIGNRILSGIQNEELHEAYTGALLNNAIWGWYNAFSKTRTLPRTTKVILNRLIENEPLGIPVTLV